MLFSRPALAAASFGFLVLAGALAGPAVGAQAPDTFPAEDRALPYSGDLPACDDPGILSAIKGQFDARQFWFGDSDLSIVAFDVAGVREVGFRKHGDEFVPRRYCRIRAEFNDGRPREVKYNIVEKGGFVGFGPGVEFCAVGEDRARDYPPRCTGAVR
jgi:hypothetical protein